MSPFDTLLFREFSPNFSSEIRKNPLREEPVNESKKTQFFKVLTGYFYFPDKRFAFVATSENIVLIFSLRIVVLFQKLRSSECLSFNFLPVNANRERREASGGWRCSCM